MNKHEQRGTGNLIDHTHVWQIFSSLLYGREFIDELASYLLTAVGKTSILECGCGDGHVLAGLTSHGFGPCIGIDTDKHMLSLSRKLSQENLVFKDMDWREIPTLGDSYGVVMCRGGSLMYLDTWNRGETVLSETLHRDKQIRKSLKNMWSATKPGGLLYVDVTPAKEISAGIKKLEFKDDSLDAKGEISCDPVRKQRKIHAEGSINGTSFSFTAVSHLYTSNDLLSDYNKIGIPNSCIDFPNLKSEALFDIVCAKKQTI